MSQCLYCVIYQREPGHVDVVASYRKKPFAEAHAAGIDKGVRESGGRCTVQAVTLFTNRDIYRPKKWFDALTAAGVKGL